MANPLDLRKPTIDLLSTVSEEVTALSQTRESLQLRDIRLTALGYDGEYLGHLDKVFGISYFTWNQSGYDAGPQFSSLSKGYVLCPGSIQNCAKTESDSEFLGDGIVPSSSQAPTEIYAPSEIQTKGGVLHIDEPKQRDDLKQALDELGAW